ncbi:MAG: exosome complex RNA-binding protein Rrp4 [Candidatus Nanohaloarchaea archaeon]|nr:exosome complex RNA-binding protein Rrp4 [Candidatus Nanohaloarchaea archaeon]
MSKLVDNRSIVVPGEPLYEGQDYSPGRGTYQEGKTIHSLFLGMAEFRKGDEIRVTPQNGKYIPQPGDSVIGEISRVSHSRWNVDLNSPYEGVLQISDAVDEYIDLEQDELADYFDLGDLIVTKVTKVTKGMDVDVTMDDKNARQLEGGRVIEIEPPKVPRLIGRRGTMVNMIKNKTNCTIIVGQNGRVWIQGEQEGLAAKACRKVDREAHISGLTDKISDWLDERKGGE